MKRRARAIAAAALFLIWNGAGTSAVQPPIAITAGEWETTTSMVDMHIPGLSAADIETIRSTVGGTRIERQCFTGRQPRVGDPFADNCTYTRIADVGGQAVRDATCPMADGPARTVALRGSISPEAYDFRLTLSDGRGGEVVTREVGRRIGDCPG